MDEVKLLERVFLNVDSVRTSLYDGIQILIITFVKCKM